MMMLRPLLLALALAASLPMTSHATPVETGIATPPTLLSIAAHAEASRAPDVARISTGVITQAADANAALRDNAVQMDKVMAALRAAGSPAATCKPAASTSARSTNTSKTSRRRSSATRPATRWT